MIGYVTLGTRDPAKAQAFYDTLLDTLGASRLMDMDSFVLWGKSMDEPCLASTLPHDGRSAEFHGLGVEGIHLCIRIFHTSSLID